MKKENNELETALTKQQVQFLIKRFDDHMTIEEKDRTELKLGQDKLLSTLLEINKAHKKLNKEIEASFDEKLKLKVDYTEFSPIKKFVGGLVAIILTAFGYAVVNSIIPKQSNEDFKKEIISIIDKKQIKVYATKK